MNRLTSLIYISRSLVEGDGESDAIAAILATSRRNNEIDVVTGALMLADGQFLQVLEGNRHLVERRFASIQRDRRHTAVHLVGQTPIAARRFSQWSMAYLSEAKAASALGGRSLEELRRSETHRAASVIDAMVSLAIAPPL